MQTSRKSFKALSMAQPIKKDIDQTLVKLQQQKRKFLSFERQEATLKEELQKTRNSLNQVKLIEPKTRVCQNKNIQKNLSIGNTDRLFLATVNKLAQSKDIINDHRRQIGKYKKLTNGIISDINKILSQNNEQEKSLLRKQQNNETIKDHLMEYRSQNTRNTEEFKSSFNALHRSSIKQQNERKKSQILRRSFYGSDSPMKESKNMLINLSEIEEGGTHSFKQPVETKNQYMTNCVPLAQERVRQLIHSNKEKIKISDNYRKFGQGLENMFSIMKVYKGRDDITFIADEFVMKEKQLKKIEQYIGKLQNRLMAYEQQMQKIKTLDKQLEKDLFLTQKQSQVSDSHYIELQLKASENLSEMKNNYENNTKWISSIGQILGPLSNNEQLNRGNVDRILAMVEAQFIQGIQAEAVSPILKVQKKDTRLPNKVNSLPVIDEKQIKAVHVMQLMSYNKMKDYAQEYIGTKK